MPIASDEEFVSRLRAGDEGAFQHLLRLHHRNMAGVARYYVRSPETAEEVVQDTWVAVIEGLGGFEGRASLKAWIYAVLANKARTRAVRDGRFTSFSELDGEAGARAPAIDPERFLPDGHWRVRLRDWTVATPEQEASDRQLLGLVRAALDKLPENQRAAIVLRDIEGMSTAEACNVLGISETNHRVLLHRGRATLRTYMDDLLAPAEGNKNVQTNV